MVKQFFKSKKAERWSKVLFLKLKGYLSWDATGICSWTSFYLFVYINDKAKHLLSLTRLFADDSSLFLYCSTYC